MLIPSLLHAKYNHSLKREGKAKRVLAMLTKIMMMGDEEWRKDNRPDVKSKHGSIRSTKAALLRATFMVDDDGNKANGLKSV
jgi:hypothetical protein